MAATYDAFNQVDALHNAIANRQKAVGANADMKDLADALKSLNEEADDIQNGKPMDFGIGPLNRELARLATMVETSDARPASPLQEGVQQHCQALTKRLAQWHELNEKKIEPVNMLLHQHNLEALPQASGIPPAPGCELK